MKILILFFISTLFPLSGFAQETDTLRSKTKNPVQGTLGFRSYWMSTSYWEDFKGDFALGQSAFLRLNTNEYKGFSLQGRYAVFGNVWSSDLTAKEPTTGNFNRYEVGLFDVNNPSDRLFGKVEELQIRYHSAKFDVVAGRMNINTPFINTQDGRLSPTFMEGVRLDFEPDKKNRFSAQVIGRMSPRSTSEWFNIGETVGIYPEGQSEFGGPSNYKGNTDSKFIAVTDWQHRTESAIQVQVNHTYVANISSTVFSQALKDWQLANGNNTFVTGLQFIVQNGVGEGGNPELDKRFKNPADLNFILGGRVGIKSKKSVWLLNYTRIDGKGRFLHPREWGKDPFFTFIPRERNEGFERVDAVTTYFQRNILEKGLQFYGFAGLHFLPDPSDIESNKFAFPSYAQANLGGRYSPKGWGKGIDFHMILMSKLNIKSGELKPKWIYNRVNMVHVNFIVNYTIQID